MDLEKAFDCITRSLLFFKLSEFKIDGKIYQAIKALYTNNKAYEKVNNSIKSDWFNVSNGVRQGDPLSTTLFNIYINDLVEHLTLLGLRINIGNDIKMCILMYADDIIFIR